MPKEAELQKLQQPAIIQLFVLTEYDRTNLGATFRFTNEPQNITWQGQVYQALPIQATGFEFKSNGALPRPKLRVENIGGLIASLISQYYDLVGSKLIRKRTLSIYLDGQPQADPTAEFPDDIYYISRKSLENNELVEFELASSLDLEEVELPRRRILRNLCRWVYRDANCQYTGGPVATVLDEPTSDPALDQCSKTLTGCKFRFGENGPLNTGAFPGAIRWS